MAHVAVGRIHKLLVIGAEDAVGIVVVFVVREQRLQHLEHTKDGVVFLAQENQRSIELGQ